MGQYLGRRALQSILSLIGLIVLVFFLARLTGDPTSLYLPVDASIQDRQEFAQRHGFDKPVYVQFIRYLGDLARLDFGTSIRRATPALGAVLNAFPHTLKLAFVAMAISLLTAIVVGSLAACRPNSIFDRMASTISLGGASTPDFWVAIMGILILAVAMGWLPTSGMGGPSYWVLPIFVLCLKPTGVLVQVVRGSMISTLQAAFITTARAKGLKPRQIIFVHALRNSMISMITVAGDQAVSLLNGAVVVETVFGWPGVGKLMIDSINQRDFALVQVAVLVTALAIFALNIVIDLIYAMLDPRIRLS